VLLGIGMAALLFVVHVTVWREARNLLARHVAYPLVAAVDTERASTFALDAASFDRTVTALREGAEPTAMEVYRAPANMDYLLAALVLIAVFPRRLYWWHLWLAHLAVGAVALAAFAAGVGWTDAGFAVGVFLRVYVLRALSLLALLVAFAPSWAGPLGAREPFAPSEEDRGDP
jgi:hypothetical protein